MLVPGGLRHCRAVHVGVLHRAPCHVDSWAGTREAALDYAVGSAFTRDHAEGKQLLSERLSLL